MFRWSLSKMIILGLASAVMWRVDLCPADQPTLDELLGLPSTGSKSEPPADPEPDPALPNTQEDPQDAQTGQPVLDLFNEAVGDMQAVSARLGDHLDAGVKTQRLQEAVLSKLDQIIASAKQQGGASSSGAGSSSSSSSGQAQRQDTGSAQNASPSSAAAAAAAGQPGAQGSNASSGAASRGSGANAQQEDGALNEGRSQWGNLPARLRDELQEGLSEPFTPLYRSLTQQYYRRLAQEGQQDDLE